MPKQTVEFPQFSRKISYQCFSKRDTKLPERTSVMLLGWSGQTMAAVLAFYYIIALGSQLLYFLVIFCCWHYPLEGCICCINSVWDSCFPVTGLQSGCGLKFKYEPSELHCWNQSAVVVLICYYYFATGMWEWVGRVRSKVHYSTEI